MRILLIIPTYRYLFNYPAYVAHSDFPTGFAYLASALKAAGHEVFGVNPNNDPNFTSAREMATVKVRRALQQYSPDLIGMGGLCTDYAFLKDMLAVVRQVSPDTPVVLGGGIVNHDSRFIFGVLRPDFCIVGEAEESFVMLAQAIQSANTDYSRIPNVGFWQDGQPVFSEESSSYPEIDSLPFPDYTPFDVDESLQKYSMASRYLYRYTRSDPRPMTLVAARSCPFSCTFCVHSHRSRYRARSLPNIMEEIEFLYERYRFNILLLLDELFAVKKSRLEEFCQVLLENRSKKGWDFDWLFQTHANARLDASALKTAKAAGCYFFSYGMESASPRVLSSMNKKTKPSQLQEALEIARAVPIGFGGNFIFGDKAENVDTINETLTFYDRYCRNAFVFIGVVTPYPGSALFDHCVAKGLIPDKLAYYETIENFAYNMTEMPTDVWNHCLQSILRLAGLPFIQHSFAKRIIREEMELYTADSMRLQRVCKVWVACAHCGQEVVCREPIDEQRCNQGQFHYVTGCPYCHQRFRVVITKEVYQESCAPCNKDPAIQLQIVQLRSLAGRFKEHGKPQDAARVLHQALELDPASHETLELLREVQGIGAHGDGGIGRTW